MEEPLVTWNRVAAFVRKHLHDVRNDLNSIDLEASLLSDMVPEGEARTSVEHIQRQLRASALNLRLLSTCFQRCDPYPASISASALLQIWQEKHEAMRNAPAIEWIDRAGEVKLKVDIQMMATVFLELLKNAATYSKNAAITVTVESGKGQVHFRMAEPKETIVDTSEWGQPFYSTERNNYGLGLWTVHNMISASGGSFVQHYNADEKILSSTITLPTT